MIILRQKEFGVWGSVRGLFKRMPSLGTPSMSNVKPMAVPRLNSRQRRSMKYRDPKSGIFNTPESKVINYSPSPVQTQGSTINFRDARKFINSRPKVNFSNKGYNGPRGTWGLGGNPKTYNIPRKTTTTTTAPNFNNTSSSSAPNFSGYNYSGGATTGKFNDSSNSSSVNIPKSQPKNTKTNTSNSTTSPAPSPSETVVTNEKGKGSGLGGLLGYGAVGLSTGVGISMLNEDSSKKENK